MSRAEEVSCIAGSCSGIWRHAQVFMMTYQLCGSVLKLIIVSNEFVSEDMNNSAYIVCLLKFIVCIV